MQIKTATPYLMLFGQANEAIAFYQEALGAKVESLQRFGDAMGANCPEAQRERVMHAALRIDGALIFLSDGGPDAPPPPGGRVVVALDIDGADRARACFEALAAGGKVIEPLFDAPWGALFGALQDRFGIGWMFNSTKS
ncbi:MAG TPA: VOC family protein [Vulgatibacter sp.]|nr:VOC family protein [Vulgatibacter sp.]